MQEKKKIKRFIPRVLCLNDDKIIQVSTEKCGGKGESRICSNGIKKERLRRHRDRNCQKVFDPLDLWFF